MTTSKINEVIATSLGFVKTVEHYSYCGEEGSVDNWTLWDNKGNKLAQGLPNYTSDLNACAVFEATLDVHLRNNYIATLWKVCGFKADSSNFWTEYNYRGFYAMVRATARQRCEAYLRTLGLWEEE